MNLHTEKVQTQYNLTAKSGRSISYIVVHYTGSTGTAENNIDYFSRANRGASADWFIDKDGAIWQFNADPENYYSWHCGDGKGKYGITNANSVGIEVVSNGEDFTSAQITSLNELVLACMSLYGVSASNVVRHYDASRKECPWPYVDSAKWAALHEQITQPSNPQPKSEPVNDAGLYYRVHVQTYGWLDPVHDGQIAGTVGKSKRVEAIKITPPKGVKLNVKVHIQGIGWKTYLGIEKGVYDPVIGTEGQGKRIEAIEVDVAENATGKLLSVETHVQSFGWTGYQPQGYCSGTVGIAKAVEAVRMKME